MTTQRKIACFEDYFVILEGGIIVERINEIKGLKEKINEIVESEVLRPVLIFKKAIETITGIKFSQSPKIDETVYSIHDQNVYKKYRDEMLSSEIIKKRNRIQKERINARKENWEKQLQVQSFFYERKVRILKDLNRIKQIR